MILIYVNDLEGFNADFKPEFLHLPPTPPPPPPLRLWMSSCSYFQCILHPFLWHRVFASGTKPKSDTLQFADLCRIIHSLGGQSLFKICRFCSSTCSCCTRPVRVNWTFHHLLLWRTVHERRSRELRKVSSSFHSTYILYVTCIIATNILALLGSCPIGFRLHQDNLIIIL